MSLSSPPSCQHGSMSSPGTPSSHRDPGRSGDPGASEAKAERRAELRRARRAAVDSGALATPGALADRAAPLALYLEGVARERPTVTVAAFWPLPAEPPVLEVVAVLRRGVEDAGARLRVLFPAASGGAELDWVEADESAAALASPGRGFGDEPPGVRHGPGALAQADLILAPALAVDRSGTRLGHGGGYYDRALLYRRPDVPVIAVVHPSELLEAGALDREEHDVPVEAVLTSEGLVGMPGCMLPLGA